VGQEHHENVDIVHDWFHSLKLINLIICSLGSHEKHGNEKCEKCGCEEEHTETGKSLFTLFRVITLHGPIERSRATDETHDGVNKRKGDTFIFNKLGHQESEWNGETNSEGRSQVFVEVLLDWLSLHGITLRVDAHTDGRNNHVEEAKKENTHDRHSRHFKINFTRRNIFCSVVHSGSRLSRSKT